MIDQPNPSEQKTSSNNGSLLQSILDTAENGQLDNKSITDFEQTTTSGNSNSPIPPKKPMSPKDFFRFVGAILVVGLIVFGSFLAYVVFNPLQAQFFISLGINPGDIQNFLKSMVTVIFGIITSVISIVWIIVLLKAYLTKKEFQKTKTIFTILAIFIGLILFTEVSLWAYLYRVIGNSDYANSQGEIIIYDNALLNSKKYVNEAKMTDFSNLIGPVTLRFDFTSNSRQVGKTINITGYKIDFNGDGKPDLEKSGVNPGSDISILWTFGQVQSDFQKSQQNVFYGNGSYKPSIFYIGTDRLTNKSTEVEIKMPSINIVGSTIYNEVPQATGGKRIAIDASSLSPLGSIEWYTSSNSLTPDSTDYKYAPDTIFKDEDMVCMKLVIAGSSPSDCTKRFIIGQAGNIIQGKIVHKQDTGNPMLYTFNIDGLKTKIGIKNYTWSADGKKTFDNSSDIFEYTFDQAGKHKVTVALVDYIGNNYTLEDDFTIMKPLKLIKYIKNSRLVANSQLKVFDSNGNSLLDYTYDPDLNVYNISGFSIPFLNVVFNAQSVQSDDPKYSLIKVEWDFDGDGKFELEGKTVKYDFVEEKKYTVVVRYTFASNEKNDIQTLEETLIFDGKKRDILPVLDITPESEYAPTAVRFDASASEVREGKIVKYTYDFGEGKGPVDGDAQMQYRYILGGEYTIRLTVTKDDGSKQTITQKLILKDGIKNVIINSSVSSGYVGRDIDFDASGSDGQITEYSWDFGDGGTSSDPRPTHAYTTPGKYTVTLKVTYLDGTFKDTMKDIIIQDPNNLPN